jgi:hypothetical protein
MTNQPAPPERRQLTRDDAAPRISEVRAVFHRLWTSQVGTPTYNKKDWQELRKLIYNHTKLEL